MIDLRRALGPDDRVMMIAPHPDDETLATGGVLAWLASEGIPARVLFLTDGENNPWAQRATEWRWRITRGDTDRWGARRRRESLAALACLGLSEGDARFLEFPDQRVTEELIRDPDGAVRRLADELEAWRPTVLLVPALHDRHPDHNATAALIQMARSRVGDGAKPAQVYEYVVHQSRDRALASANYAFVATSREAAAKRRAILCHSSQLRLRRRFMLGFGGRPEHFAIAGHAPLAGGARHPLSLLSAKAGEWTFAIRRTLHASIGCAALILVSQDDSPGSALRFDLPQAAGTRALCTPGGREPIGEIRAHREGGMLHFTVTAPALNATAHRFAKLDLPRERGLGFFDTWGWLDFGLGAEALAPLESQALVQRSAARRVAPAARPLEIGATSITDETRELDPGYV